MFVVFGINSWMAVSSKFATDELLDAKRPKTALQQTIDDGCPQACSCSPLVSNQTLSVFQQVRWVDMGGESVLLFFPMLVKFPGSRGSVRRPAARP